MEWCKKVCLIRECIPPIPEPPGQPAVTICRANMTTGFPENYNVTINTGGTTIKDTVSALSNGTATYSFAYTGSGIPTASATAINCAGNATKNASATFPPCKPTA